MSETFVQLPPDGTGKMLRAESLTVGSNVVLQEVMSIADAVGNLLVLDGSGRIGISNFPASYPVTGTFWQATQPVSMASLPSGAATAANQATEISSLASIVAALTNPLPVSVSGLPLPSGAATSALQTTGNTSLASIVTALGGTLAISAASLPLPSGASTSALQTTGNTSLASIVTALAGTLTISGTITANVGTTNGLALDATLTGGTQKTLIFDGTNNIFTSAHAGYVQFASPQHVIVDSATLGTVAISAASLPLPSNAAQETGGNLATLAGAVTSSKVQVNQAQVSGTAVSVNNGTTDAGTQRVTLSSDSTGQVKLAAGSAVIGHVIADSGSTTAVTSLPATPAGSNLIGKVGIDQTTPGTTNAVQDASDGPVAAGSAASKSSLGGLVAATAAPTPTNGQQIALQGDTSGNLRTSPYGATGSFTTKVATGTGSANPTLTVPAGQKWVVVGITINATIANSGSARLVALFCQDSNSKVFASAVAGVNAPINALTRYTFAPSLPTSTAVVSSNASVGYPQVILGPGMILNASVSGVAGDSIEVVANVMVFPD